VATLFLGAFTVALSTLELASSGVFFGVVAAVFLAPLDTGLCFDPFFAAAAAAAPALFPPAEVTLSLSVVVVVVVLLLMATSVCASHHVRGKSGPALGGTEFRLVPSACRLIVRAKL